MSINDSLTTTMLKAVFVEEIAACGGEVHNAFDDGLRLFLRSVLPQVKEVRAGDAVQGGVVLRSSGTDVWVHPYIFRQVCSNGAIMAQSIQTRHVAGLDVRPADEVLPELREAIQCSAAPEAFRIGAQQMSAAQQFPVDLGLTLSTTFAGISGQFVALILRMLFDQQDHSLFGLANAITATARDTQDPESRWELEELGVLCWPIPIRGHPIAMTTPRPPQPAELVAY